MSDEAKSREELVKELNELRIQNAVLQTKILGGVIPICSWCKSIRDDQGYWQKIEAYISDHTEAQFSHGICPECTTTHFPEINMGDFA